MGAETPATATPSPDTETAEATVLATPAGLTLMAAPLTRWPDALLEQLRRRGPVRLMPLAGADPAGAATAAPAAATPAAASHDGASHDKESQDDDPDGANGAEAPIAVEGNLLLGYADPRPGLAEALEHEPAADPAALLAAWQRGCERLLRHRRRGGSEVRLINLNRLDARSQATLLELLDAEAPPEVDIDAEPLAEDNRHADAAPPARVALPAVVEHYLAQRPEIDQLLADLEGSADLLGREPEPPWAVPPLRGLVLAERLLEEWREDRASVQERLGQLQRDLDLSRAERATTSGVLADVAGLQRQAEAEVERLHRLLAEGAEREEEQQRHNETLRAELVEARQQQEEARREAASAQRQVAEAQQQWAELERRRDDLEAELEEARRQQEEARRQVAEARRQAEEEEARQRDGEEERELILLQLKQVQDELSHTFQELTQARESGQQLEQRLAALEQECRTLFLHSRLSPQVDRSKIATILQLMRDNLRV